VRRNLVHVVAQEIENITSNEYEVGNRANANDFEMNLHIMLND
jgi:hypothetical protein